jgi:hypothetical protein
MMRPDEITGLGLGDGKYVMDDEKGNVWKGSGS